MPLPKNNGFIVLYRSLRKKSYYQNATVMRVWLELLLLATYDRDEFEFNGKTMVLLPGELVTGRKALAKSLRVSESSVERALTRLETEQQIEQRTDRQCRVITIKNWATYQNANNKSNNDRTTIEQRPDTLNKETKKQDNNRLQGEQSTPPAPTPRDEAIRFFTDPASRQPVIDWMVTRGVQPDLAVKELDKFISYWTEPTLSGKAQRWEKEKAFEIRRRLATWLGRASKDAQRFGKTGQTWSSV